MKQKVPQIVPLTFLNYMCIVNEILSQVSIIFQYFQHCKGKQSLVHWATVNCIIETDNSDFKQN